MNNLQHRPIERSGVIEIEDIVLDPVSNEMYVPEGVLVLSQRSCSVQRAPHNGHVFN